jgi:hypothetical protein
MARTLTQAEIPIGIITALLGAPLFTLLLVQSRRAQHRPDLAGTAGQRERGEERLTVAVT